MVTASHSQCYLVRAADFWTVISVFEIIGGRWDFEPTTQPWQGCADNSKGNICRDSGADQTESWSEWQDLNLRPFVRNDDAGWYDQQAKLSFRNNGAFLVLPLGQAVVIGLQSPFTTSPTSNFNNLPILASRRCLAPTSCPRCVRKFGRRCVGRPARTPARGTAPVQKTHGRPRLGRCGATVARPWPARHGYKVHRRGKALAAARTPEIFGGLVIRKGVYSSVDAPPSASGF